jgi:hypothetical protein
MHVLQSAEVGRWSQLRRILADESTLTFADGRDYRCVEIQRPPEAARRLALAYSLLMTGTPADDEEQFDGCLLWLTDYAIWSPTFERIGLRFLESLAAGIPESGAGARLFGATDFVDAQATLSLCLLFEWDAYLAPNSGEFIAFVSHDGPVHVIARTPAHFESLFRRFDNDSWHGRERKCPDSLIRG